MLEGDRVRLQGEDEPSYAGTLEGDIMRLEPQGEAEPTPALVLGGQ